ncbi:hypothetical protein LIER_40113 [Lithospermum erythrorhizon]|uniref:Uncharacterized protein n=1 Tax=Lithospermum erythrorhizon TaxID=34254 RepID=A0AAV3QS98_LITER
MGKHRRTGDEGGKGSEEDIGRGYDEGGVHQGTLGGRKKVHGRGKEYKRSGKTSLSGVKCLAKGSGGFTGESGLPERDKQELQDNINNRRE